MIGKRPGDDARTPVRIFVGGGQEFHGPTSIRDELIARLLPPILHKYVPEAEIVTGGMPGVGEVFSKGWPGARLDVVSGEYAIEYGRRCIVAGKTGTPFMIIGESQEKRRLAVTALEGIACALFIQGGKYSTHEIKLFSERGVPVVTLYGGGGAAGGQCPYDGWHYEPHPSVLTSAVASTDPSVDHVHDIINELVRQILFNIPGRGGLIQSQEEESKRQKRMDLKASTSGYVEEPTKVAFVFDVESRGDDAARNGIISIGYCVGRLDRLEVLEKGRIDLAPLQYMEHKDVVVLDEVFVAFWHKTYNEANMHHFPMLIDPPEGTLPQMVRVQTFEKRCLEEFWLNEEKHPGIGKKLQNMEQGAMDPIKGITLFRDVLDKWDDRERGWQACIISDNVAFDCRMVNHYLSVANLPSLAYDKTRTWYRRNYDTVSYARGVEHMNYDSLWIKAEDLIAKYGLSANTDNYTHMPEDDAEFIYRLHVELMLKVSQETNGGPI